MKTDKNTCWKSIAQKLWEQGTTLLPIDESLVRQSREGFKHFLQRRDEQKDHADWSLQRRGEDECDVGLVQRNGGLHDVKSFFHHDDRLNCSLLARGVLTDETDTHFLLQNLALLDSVNEAGKSLARALDTRYGLNCAALYESCLRNGHLPYFTTTLRSLYYRDSPGQVGAQEHIDRSFLTIHLGDQGGSLQTPAANGEWVDISPPEGFAVAFFGVKALWVTKGRKGPLLHRSVTVPGKDRFAFVHFGHVPLKFHSVRKASESAEDFTSLFLPAITSGLYHWQ